MKNTLIMGVINLTPDSFSDGGDFFNPSKAFKKILDLMEEGADIIDIGAESTRPGAEPISVEEEWNRLFPVLERLSRSNLSIPLSIDTRRGEIMKRVIDSYDVSIINDVNGGADESVLEAIARRSLTYLAMHKHGCPQTMQQSPLTAGEALKEVAGFYQQTREKLLQFGFNPHQIWLDPGIGFGKTDAANLQLLKQVSEFTNSYNIAIGISRKSFLGRILDIKRPKDRDSASKMAEMSLLFANVKAIRTHDVAHLSVIKKLLLSEQLLMN